MQTEHPGEIVPGFVVADDEPVDPDAHLYSDDDEGEIDGAPVRSVEGSERTR